MRTALLSLSAASSTDDRSAFNSASSSSARPAARPPLRPSRQAQRAYVRRRFIVGWCAINPAVGRAIRRHRARTERTQQPLAPLGLLRALAS